MTDIYLRPAAAEPTDIWLRDPSAPDENTVQTAAAARFSWYPRITNPPEYLAPRQPQYLTRQGTR